MSVKNMDDQKKKVALVALDYINYKDIVGVGTGSTVNFFIEKLKLLKGKILGVTCHSSKILANNAIQNKADYVAFGPVFKTLSKKKKKINFDKAVFVLRKLRLPLTLIGGINHTNFMELVKYKPLNLAMINSIWDYERGPVKSALVFKKILNEKS